MRMSPFFHRAAVATAVECLLAAWAATGQTLPPREVSLVAGRGELLQFERDIQRVAISEPKIADAIVVSPREVMVNAKGAGRATLIVWEGNSLQGQFNVNVVSDTSEADAHRKATQAALQATIPEGIVAAANG